MTAKSTRGTKPATVKNVAAKKPPTSARKAVASSRARPVVAKTPSVASKSKVVAPLKKDKPKKIKMVRDSFTMPESDFEKLSELKKKCIAAGVPVKKSELLRVGLMSILKLSNASLVAAVKQLAVKK